MRKRVYRRALRIAAQCFARAGYCTNGEEYKIKICGVVYQGDPICERCIRDFFREKAVKELRQEGRL